MNENEVTRRKKRRERRGESENSKIDKENGGKRSEREKSARGEGRAVSSASKVSI